MAHSRRLYENLPLYAQLADERGLLQHFCDAGVQPIVDDVFQTLRSREFFFNPTHLASTPHRDWLGQFVGLGIADGHWLGIGINPDWTPADKGQIILQAIDYWLRKGTTDAEFDAIRMWLQFSDPIRLIKTTPNTPQRLKWADYYTRYDAPAHQTFLERRLQGGGDYYDTTYKPRWTVAKPKHSHWNYQVVWSRHLEEHYAKEQVTKGSRLGSRNVWKVFEPKNATEWNKVFPDIEVLDIETLPALTRPTNIGWWKYGKKSGLTFDVEPSEDALQERRSYEMAIEGYKFTDVFPAFSYPERTESTTIKTPTKYLKSGQWVDWHSQWGILRDREIPLSQRLKVIATTITAIIPYAQWGSVYRDRTYDSSRSGTWEAYLFRGHSGFRWQREWYPTFHVNSVTTETVEVLNGNWHSAQKWERQQWHRSGTWYAAPFQRINRITTETPVAIAANSYYSPAYKTLRFIESSSTTPIPVTNHAKIPFLGNQWPALRPQRTIESFVDVDVLPPPLSAVFQYEPLPRNLQPNPEPPPPPPPEPRQWVAINQGFQWGDSRSRTITYTEIIRIDGDVTTSAQWGTNWQQQSWYVDVDDKEVARSRTVLPFKNEVQLWCDRYTSIVYELDTHWQSVGTTKATDYDQIIGHHYPWYSPARFTQTKVLTGVSGNSAILATPLYDLPVDEDNVGLPQTNTVRRIAYAVQQWGQLKRWYKGVTARSRSTTTIVPGHIVGGAWYKRNAYTKVERVIDETLPGIVEQTLSYWWYFYQKSKTKTSTLTVTPSLGCRQSPTNPVPIKLITPGERTWIPTQSPWTVNTFDVVPEQVTTRIVRDRVEGVFPGAQWQWQMYPANNVPIAYTNTVTPAKPEIIPSFLIQYIAERQDTVTVNRRNDGNFPGSTYFHQWYGYQQPDIGAIDVDNDFAMDLEYTFTYQEDWSDTIALSDDFSFRPVISSIRSSTWWYYPATDSSETTVTTTPARWRFTYEKGATYHHLYGQSYGWMSSGEAAVSEQIIPTPIVGAIATAKEDSYYVTAEDAKEEVIIEPGYRSYNQLHYASFSRQYRHQQVWYVVNDLNQYGYWDNADPIIKEGTLCNVPDLYTRYNLEYFVEKIVIEVIEGDRDRLYPEWLQITNIKSWQLIVETVSGAIITQPATMLWTEDRKKGRKMKYSEHYNNLLLEFVIGLSQLRNSRVRFISLMLGDRAVFSQSYDPLLENQNNYLGFEFLIPVRFVAITNSML